MHAILGRQVVEQIALRVLSIFTPLLPKNEIAEGSMDGLRAVGLVIRRVHEGKCPRIPLTICIGSQMEPEECTNAIRNDNSWNGDRA